MLEQKENWNWSDVVNLAANLTSRSGVEANVRTIGEVGLHGGPSECWGHARCSRGGPL